MAQSSPEAEAQRSVATIEPGLANEDDAAVLAKLGYKQELRRSFSVLEVFGVAFSIMALVPSIAATLVYSLPAGPAGLVWGWFLPSGLIFVVGLAMADLGSAMPTSGGLYWWTHFFSSPKARNPLCFLVGYSNTLGLVAGLCSIDYGFALMLLSVVVIARDGEWAPTNGAIYGTYAAAVVTHGILASTLQKIMGKLQTFFAFLNILLILATIIALPIGASGRRNDGHFIFATIDNLTTWPTGWTFMLAWLMPIWTIGAFDSAVHMSEEATNATKAVPAGILWSIGSCWGFGFLVVIVIAATIKTDIAALTETKFGQPMAQIYYDAIGKQGTLALMSLLFIVQFFMGLSIVVAASRQTWAFSRDGALPFSTFFRPISKRFGYIPLRTIWGVVGLALVLGLLTLIAGAAAQALFSLVITGNNLAWGIPIFARVVWGQHKFKPGYFYTGDRFSKPIAWVALVFLVFGEILAMFPVGGPNPTPDVMNYTVVVSGVVWLGSLTYYYIDAHKWFTGPKLTIDVGDLNEDQKVAVREENLHVGGASEDHHNVDIGNLGDRKEGTQVTETAKSDSS